MSANVLAVRVIRRHATSSVRARVAAIGMKADEAQLASRLDQVAQIAPALIDGIHRGTIAPHRVVADLAHVVELAEAHVDDE